MIDRKIGFKVIENGEDKLHAIKKGNIVWLINKEEICKSNERTLYTYWIYINDYLTLYLDDGEYSSFLEIASPVKEITFKGCVTYAQDLK